LVVATKSSVVLNETPRLFETKTCKRFRPASGGPSSGDDSATTAEGRELPPVEPQVEAVDAPAADAPDNVVGKAQVEDPTKLDESGGKG